MEPVWRANSGICGRRTGADRRSAADPAYKGPERRIAEDRRRNRDQRQHKRYRVRDFTFVKLHSENKGSVGQLLDIGKGGLSFRFFVNIEKTGNCDELDIFLSGGSFTINRIPFKTSSDLLLANRSPFSPAVLKRFGVQFKPLTSDQNAGLDRFISAYTVGQI